MGQLRFAKVSLILLSSTLAAACSSIDERTPAVADSSSPVDMNTPAAMNDPAAPAEMAGEAPTSEVPPAPGSTEGQSAPVGLAPPSMENATPPVGEMPPGTEPVAPEANEPAADGAPVPSAGCGSTAAVQSGRFTIDVAGAAREYILELPEDYDPNRAHRLIFGWHWLGGNAQQVANGFYGLEERAEGSAIFVSAEGIDAGWANTNGRDLAFLDAMLGRLEGELCIDESRIFSTGWSYGGMMSLAVGCARGDVFRAIAPMSGALYSGCEDGDAPVAFFGYHGDNDDVVPYANGVTARNVFVERNGCQPESAAIEVNGCLQFQNCTAGAPVTWCEFNGGHTPGPGSEQALWDFFSQF
jgi:polyhydroxybutyrate depolymerase